MNAARGHERGPLLHAELHWLMRLRWLAAATTLLIALLPWARIGWSVPLIPLVLLSLGIAACNAIVWTIDRRISDLSQRWRAIQALATTQVYLDIAGLFTLILLTGALHSPFLGFLAFPMAFSTLLQTRARAYLSAVATIAVVILLLFVEQGPIHHTDVLMAVSWCCTLATIVYVTDRITRSLYRRELAGRRQARKLRALSSRLSVQQRTMVNQENMAAMGQLAAGIAHEIANPLSSMDSLLQLMQRNPDKPRPDAISNLRDQIQRISRTIRQLTTYSHPGDGSYEVIPINQVVRSSLDMLAFDRRLKSIKLESELSEGSGLARVNSHAMEQVLANLYRNALDAVESAPQPQLRVSTRGDNGSCVIEVADNGSGIAPEHLGKIFDPFFTTKPAGQGTGLGLSISAKFVREHGGRLEVSSTPGQGTTFTIRLPRDIHAVDASSSPQTPPPNTTTPGATP